MAHPPFRLVVMAHPPYRLVMAHRQLGRLSLRSRADSGQPVSICHHHKKQHCRLLTTVPACLLMSGPAESTSMTTTSITSTKSTIPSPVVYVAYYATYGGFGSRELKQQLIKNGAEVSFYGDSIHGCSRSDPELIRAIEELYLQGKCLAHQIEEFDIKSIIHNNSYIPFS